MIVNGQETLKSLGFRTREFDIGGYPPQAGHFIMSLWLDSVIYQCVFRRIQENVLIECDTTPESCCSTFGSYCDAALNGQLLVENNLSELVVINEIILYTEDASGTCSQFGINKWCIDNTDDSLGSFMQINGYPASCDADPITDNWCWLDRSSINICDTIFPGQDLTNIEAICIEEDPDQCAPLKQLMFFDFGCNSGTQSTVTLWMDGTNTEVETETCEPTAITSNPTTVTMNPTTPSATPTEQPTTPTNNPTKSPTRDDEDESSDSSE